MEKYIWFIAGVALALTGCSGEDPVSAAGAGPAAKLTVSGDTAGGKKPGRRPQTRPFEIGPHELRFDRELEVSGLVINWLEVQDSRCPQDVTCVWEGEVKVVLGITGVDERLDRVEIVLNGAVDGGAVVENRGYEIRLMDVRPYPREGVQVRRGEYVAIFHINPVPKFAPTGGLIVSRGEAGGGGERPRPQEPEQEPELGPRPDYAALKAALAENRGRWQALGAKNYRFEFQRTCFCLTDYTRSALLTVEQGRIVRAVYADSGEQVREEVREHYRTVDGLFKEIEEAIADRAVQIDVTYDAKTGLPTRIDIDRSRMIADEEQYFLAGKLEILL